MSTSSCIDYEKLVKTNNTFWIDIESNKLKFLVWLMSHPSDRLVQEIYQYPTIKKNPDYNNDNYDPEYALMCSKLWEQTTHYDAGCSSTMSHLYQFVSDMVTIVVQKNVLALKENLAHQIAQKQTELAQLQEKYKHV
jgi:hypothetical protein